MRSAARPQHRVVLNDGGNMNGDPLDELDEQGAEIARLRAEIERLRLTATERGSLDRAAAWLAKAAESRKDIHTAGYLCDDAAVLRSILERFN